jgi:pyruvate formate lyase activating enzyme
MRIGGFQKTSLLDYPDTISAIVWTIGCNFRCPFCYNKDIVEGCVGLIPEKEILSLLEKRRGLLEGLVITGGEPLLQEDIVDFITTVKDLGYKVKVDTNGAFPDRLRTLIDNNILDYVSMDVKAPKEKYGRVAGTNVDISAIEKSIDIVKNSGLDYEFRVTVVPGLLEKEDILELSKWLEGSQKFFLQQFKSDTPLVSSSLQGVKPYPKEYLLEILDAVKPCFALCDLRGV